jgi:hypothetical protein
LSDLVKFQWVSLTINFLALGAYLIYEYGHAPSVF